MEKLKPKEPNTLYFMLDTFLGKQKLKDVLSNVLEDVKKKIILSWNGFYCFFEALHTRYKRAAAGALPF